MIVRDVMTQDVVIATSLTTVQSAAVQMKRRKVGFLPVTEGQHAVGVLTDRDVVVRACAQGKDPRDTVVKEIMTRNVIDCLETQTVEEAGILMEKNHVHRIVVTNHANNIVGVISLDDLAKKVRNPTLSNDVLRHVSTVQPKKH